MQACSIQEGGGGCNPHALGVYGQTLKSGVVGKK